MRSAVPPGTDELSDEDLESLYALPPGRHVRANFVTALDGAVEVGGRSGALGSEGDRRVFATLRALTDVVLVGAGTVRQEDYGPARLAAPRRERRRSRGQGPAPAVAVVSGSAALDPVARLFTETVPGGPRPLVLTAATAPAGRRAALAEVADVVICGEADVPAGVALDELAARGYAHALCEGGPALLTQLLTAGLVDELCLTHAPVIAGPGRVALVSGTPWPTPVHASLAGLIAADDALIARYRIAGEVPAPTPGGRP